MAVRRDLRTLPVRAKPADVAVRDTLGAFCAHASLRIEGARGGPLAGLTFAAKDLFDVAGYACCFGNPDWLRTHAPARRSAPAIRMLLAAGATLVGKTLTDELAFSVAGENIHYGTPLNPRAPERTCGGSSCGSASAVAGALVDFALGTDTGGSVRVPAAFCGLYGMRPSHGRVPIEGVIAHVPSADTVGWMAPDAEMLGRVG
ncbi:MAG: amidase family protein, partial [Candidatus Binataceae bacterium]